MSAKAASVAIVHERFTELGGSEKVVAEMHALWPQARIHTTVVDRRCLPAGLDDADIVPSRLQRLYRGGPTYAHLLPLMPGAMSRLDLDGADVVVTSHHAFANRVAASPGRVVISYTHTPARWMWDPRMRRAEVEGRLGRSALTAFSASQRAFDRRAARRLRAVVANSTHVADRIRSWWGTDAAVIHPPVDTDSFTLSPATTREDFFLLAGRLVPYKRSEVAILAARRAGVRLVVAGDGRSRPALEQLGGANVEFLGAVDHRTLVDLFRRTRALVFPGEEDFGLVPVEAQACGAPVIALRRGGVMDTVIDGSTGLLYSSFDGDDVATLAARLVAFDPDAFDPVVIRRHAEQFSRTRFRERLSAHVGSVLAAR